MKNKQAFWSLLLLFIYYNVDRWMPLGNWNGEHHWPVTNDQFTLDIVVGAVLLVAMFSFYRGMRTGMVLGTSLLALWAYFHLQSWWIPYAEGVHSPGAIAFHSQFLQDTQVLPTFGHHFAPDAEHTFIDVFVFPSLVLCLFASLRAFRRRPARN